MAQSLAKWFVTKAGQKFTFRIVCATSIGICSAYTIPNTMLLYKYQEIVHLYKTGIPVKLTDAVMQRFNKAIDLLELPDVERKLIKPFAVFGFDMFNAGTLFSQFGGLLGIPINFTYIDEQEIDKSAIMVNNEPVNWSSEAGEQLLYSLTLSENAQLYAIAREALYLNSFKLILNTIYATSTFIVMYSLGHRLNETYKLLARPLIFRSAMYTIIGVFGFGIYSFLTDYTQVSYDISVDKKLCKKSPIFVEGGKEFYEKIVMRNVALRKLMGPLGERYYSVMGNENFFLRQKRLPLITRRDYFESRFNGVL